LLPEVDALGDIFFMTEEIFSGVNVVAQEYDGIGLSSSMYPFFKVGNILVSIFPSLYITDL